jgi:CubicO group peptidase (beta-lactamase class C family)
LTHRSGLPFYQYTFDKMVRSKDLYPVNQNIMEWFAQAQPMPPKFNEPDRFFSYNNTNFAILASLIECISGQNYATYLKKNIFEPLKMNDSFVILPNTNLADSTIAHGHQFGGELAKDWYDYVLGDKGVYCTTTDLLKYYRGLRDAKILKKASIDEMFKPRSFEKKGTRNYGYGFRLSLDSSQSVKSVFHTGWWKGFNTMFFMDPKNDILIIILGNKYSHTPYDIRSIWAVLKGENTFEPDEQEDE